MNLKQLNIILFIGIITIGYSCSRNSSSNRVENISVADLKCEMLENPLGIDSKEPKLSWIIYSDQRNIQQKSYQILVASSAKLLEENIGDVWNSGKVESNQSVHVKFNGSKLKSKTRYFWKVKVWSQQGESDWSEPSFWSMGMLRYKDWSGRWIGFDRAFPWDDESRFSRLSARYFRKEIEIQQDKKIKSATAYIIGLGLYELYINGDKIGDQVLAPTPTDYTKNVKYNTFDVTDKIVSGENAIGVILGNGRFYTMRQNFKPYKIKTFGYPKMLFNLIVEYTDGSKETFRTDNSWKGTADGPIRSNNEYDGEDYDARKEMPGWSKAKFDDSKWLNAEYVQEPTGRFEAQMNENMKVMQIIPAISVKKMGPKRYIVDLGQNIAGWVKLSATEKKGHKITLRYAESLDENGELFTAPLRDAKVTDTYIFKGNTKESWSPRFVYHGFRFIEISGLTKTPSISDIEGCVVYDNMITRGSFTTSNPLINQIYKNAFWSINGTYKGMPIDCPQRNERMPWLGDRAIGCFGESFVLDNSKLYTKWLDDIKFSQKADGSISDVAPTYFRYYSDNMTWPGTYLFVAQMLHQQYGLTEPVIEHYPHMKKWLDYMVDHYLTEFILTKDSYGDWCAPPKTIEEGRGKSADVKKPSQLISTAFLYHYLQIMQDFARLSGNSADVKGYLSLSDSVKMAFNNKFLNADSVYYGSKTLTENLLALSFNLVPEENRQELINTIESIINDDNSGHLSVGLIGAQWLMRSLAENGLNDLAYKLATNTTYPSWGYMVENGATSIWELWNATTAAPKMNSQNHVMMLGDLIIWYYENIAGIKSDSKQPGFKKILMNPTFPSKLEYTDASYLSVYGEIVSHWQQTSDGLDWQINIPANTSAEVHIPATDINKILEGDLLLTKAYGINKVSIAKNEVILEIGSGTYNFKVKN